MQKRNNPVHITVIISTYNKPAWLQKVLWGYEQQSYSHFDIVIADDGSGAETKQLIEQFIAEGKLQIQHVWHEDNGFQKTTILNKALAVAQHEYILFTDGDCIPRNDFLETHIKHLSKGYFLSGGYCKLPMDLSEAIQKEDVISQSCFEPTWLKAKGLTGSSQLRKLSASEKWGAFLDFITPAGATFNGCNASAWKQDLLQVNGFDERMEYGGEDREIGERLMNMGIKTKQIRHRAILVHLDHGRGYVTQEALDLNLKIRKETKKQRKVYTNYGMKKETK